MSEPDPVVIAVENQQTIHNRTDVQMSDNAVGDGAEGDPLNHVE
jgi:hypothetical protein